MTRLLCLSLFATLVTSAAAQAEFQLGAISTTTERYTLNGVTTAYEFVLTRISVPADMPSSELVIKTYYFSGDRVHLGTGIGGLALRQSDIPKGGGRVTMPAQLEAGKKYEFRFPVPQNAGKWKRVIVVLGKKGDMIGKIHPKDDWTKFEFPDKATVRMSQ